MNILVVYCHPLEGSFTQAVLQAALRGFKAAGHQVHLIDLYGEGFNPVMSGDERARYLTDVAANAALVAPHIEALQACDALVVVYPTWYYGPPAMLKGWLERVFLPDIVFKVPRAKGQRASGNLKNIRVFMGLTTSGSPWWWLRLIRDPGRNLWLRGLRPLFHARCKFHWLQLYSMNNVTPKDCSRHLQRVESTCARIA
jgi:putative NADPH-quinone reductase